MKAILDLIDSYKGNISKSDNKVSIVANNTLYNSYNEYDEKLGKLVFVVDKPVKVECELTIIKDKNRYSIDAWEKTCEIIGGFNGNFDTQEKALQVIESMLKKYNFQRKVCQQLSLFDFE